MLMSMWEAYLRPSEALALRSFQLLSPVVGERGTASGWVILVHAAELGRPGKTGEFDTSVPLDLERQKLLSRPLERLKKVTSSQDLVFPFSYVHFADQFKKGLQHLGLGHLKMSPYCCRHGGASQDRAEKLRSVEAVAKRGGWRSFASIRRYEKHGRLNLVLQSMPEETRTKAKLQEKTLSSILVIPSRSH